MRIDFVSDVSCPWCAIGLKSLEAALERIGDGLQVELRFQPFELNPQMPKQGQDALEHLTQKYGTTVQQIERSQERIRERGEALGFTFGPRHRVYNTFDAHRLLHWAGLQGLPAQRALAHALFETYFTRGEDPSDTDILVRVAGEVGLDAAQAREVLQSNAYADEVRAREQHYRDEGIHAVPSVIIDDEHLIQGGQPTEVFEEALREIAAQRA